MNNNNELKKKSIFNFIGIKRFHLVIIFWFLLVFFLISFIILGVNYNTFGFKLAASYIVFVTPFIVGTFLLGMYLYQDNNGCKRQIFCRLNMEDIKRQIKIAAACYGVYVGLAILVGAIESIFIVENGMDNGPSYSTICLVYGYPVIAIICWPFFLRNLK